ncbi:hypothetical protein GUJ93_ZPchr0009g130 [Zizania palustris]|uniref:Uncharacterized protein n=1 Tax=Zizania palustris TaxID=103762 RepID=A0A8J5V932_ZIZPA|nr:hypothetical protein GUJ93_ZPchr0009g130 [Zizania palustris]
MCCCFCVDKGKHVAAADDRTACFLMPNTKRHISCRFGNLRAAWLRYLVPAGYSVHVKTRNKAVIAPRASSPDAWLAEMLLHACDDAPYAGEEKFPA